MLRQAKWFGVLFCFPARMSIMGMTQICQRWSEDFSGILELRKAVATWNSDKNKKQLGGNADRLSLLLIINMLVCFEREPNKDP